MKKKILSVALTLALLLPALTVPAGAFRAEPYVRHVYKGVLSLIVYDETGKSQVIQVYDEAGNQLYQQVGDDPYEWEKLDVPISAAEAQRRGEEQRAAELAEYGPKVKAKKAEIERTYRVRFDYDLEGSKDDLDWLTNWENCILKIPTPLWKAANAVLAKQGKTLTIGPGSVDSGSGAAYYTPKLTRISFAVATPEELLSHEYGHFLFSTILPQIYGSGALRSKWTAQNGGIAYGDYTAENPAFVTSYASTNVDEDFADTFAVLMGTYQSESFPASTAKQLIYDYPDSIAAKKLFYARQLLCEAFSLDPSVFPDIVPSYPSGWAKAGVEEYQNTIGDSSDIWYGVIPCAGDVHRTSYQAGATRQSFAFSMHAMVKKLGNCQGTRYWMNQDFDQSWHVSSDVEIMVHRGTFPFADVTMMGNSAYPIHSAVYALYKNGVVSGTSSTTFNPDGLITRQEAAAMLYRLCKALDYELPQGTLDFADADQVAPWAREAVAAISAAGIMKGVGNNQFNPTGVYTNEQSAVTLLRVYKMLTETA